MIKAFDGNNDFLSNFYPCKITFEGMTYLNSEAAFQAAKTLDMDERLKFTNLNPSEAKKRGRRVELRPDWEEVKETIILEILRDKFGPHNQVMMHRLLMTKDEELIEGNCWHDNYWGSCSCSKCKDKGKNRLGILLMQVREEMAKY